MGLAPPFQRQIRQWWVEIHPTSGFQKRHPRVYAPQEYWRGRTFGFCRCNKSARFQETKPKPRAWLRHTPYLNGRGRLKKQNPLFRRPLFLLPTNPRFPDNRNRVRGLRHTPYLNGRGRLKKQNLLFRRPLFLLPTNPRFPDNRNRVRGCATHPA
ncbi:hypothetical protein HMPREF9123_1930 [Neisseria bacilliformis ATCC BAA-1200]|uniref:Uncharacterized protein n=1 Tax=Neisseria bacilliformis ATCC BAA-1200 TaxID=888742 RepID=F2BDX4_9NEIS|nr:hypothetical protein HMPREF9123_1930 [Neisseria bacilliformis ATCC BAA-1200]